VVGLKGFLGQLSFNSRKLVSYSPRGQAPNQALPLRPPSWPPVGFDVGQWWTETGRQGGLPSGVVVTAVRFPLEP
jgi:hypothetical protein